MRPIVTDRVEWFVGRSVTVVSPAKTAESIEQQFRLRTRVAQGNHVLDGVPDNLIERGNFERVREGPPIVKHMGTFCGELCKNV